MKIQTMPFTTLKSHFEGETFSPVEVNNVFELQSTDSVLVGIKGNPYGFATAENAAKWLDNNLIKTSQAGETKQNHIDKLIIANSISPADYLQTEIEVITARNAGEWSIYFYDDLLLSWGEVAKGGTGLTGAAGADGAAGAQGIQGVKGDSGITWQYPVGYVLIDAANNNPFTFLGYGTWQAFGAGRVLVGLDGAQSEFDSLGEVGGEKTNTLTANQMPIHTHVQNAHNHVERVGGAGTGSVVYFSNGGITTGSAAGTNNIGNSTANTTATNQTAGGGEAHNNLQPYIIVNFWKRSA